MKQAIFFIIVIVTFLASCEKETQSEKINFYDLRLETNTNFTIVDNSTKESTILLFKNKIIFESQWDYTIYSYTKTKTRLLWAETKNNYNLILHGPSNLYYNKLYIIRPNESIVEHNIIIYELIDARLINNGSTIWFKYNNSWLRSGPMKDEESKINLP